MCYHCPGVHATLCKVVDVAGLQADLRDWLVEDGEEAQQGMSGMRIQAGMHTLSSDGTLITEKLLGTNGPAGAVSGGITIMPNLIFYAVFYIERTQRGVASRHFTPGPLSADLEAALSTTSSRRTSSSWTDRYPRTQGPA